MISVIAVFCNAQIVITASDMTEWYKPGKARKLYNAIIGTYSMDIGVASSVQAQAWILPAVLFQDSSLSINIEPNSVSYSEKFPTATHAAYSEFKFFTTTVTSYGFYRLSADSIFVLGGAMRQQTATKDTVTFSFSQLAPTKMFFGLNEPVTIKKETTYFSPGSFDISVTTTETDGYETLKLPNGTFSCLRQKSIKINSSYSNNVLTKKRYIGNVYLDYQRRTFCFCRTCWSGEKYRDSSSKVCCIFSNY